MGNLAPSAPRARNLVLGYIRLLIRFFFRRIEVAGLENIPTQGGGVLVSWHPNGWIDGAVLTTHFPYLLVCGGRHGILRIPVLGWMMRQCGAVPIYRREDQLDSASGTERQVRNRASIDALARAVADGDFAMLFPEGLSHDDPFLHPLRTGAAHLYYRASELTPSDSPRPTIVPVALHYNKKSIWGSQVLVTYHPAMSLPADLARPAASDEERSAQAHRLTSEIERVLQEVVLATESWELHHLLQRMRKLVRAEGLARRGEKSVPTSIAESVRHFGRAWRNYQVCKEHFADEIEQLLEDIAFYDGHLRALRVQDHELDGAGWNLSSRKTLLVLLEFAVVYLVLPVFLVIGVVVNLPTMLLLQALTKTAAAKNKDEASIKVLVGAAAFPLTWLLVAILVAWGGSELAAGYPRVNYSPALTAVIAFALSAFGGLLVVQFRQIARETLRTLGVRITLTRRRQAVKWLLEKRAGLFDRLLALDAKVEAYDGSLDSVDQH